MLPVIYLVSTGLFAFSRTSHKWNHTICTLLCMASFTWHGFEYTDLWWTFFFPSFWILWRKLLWLFNMHYTYIFLLGKYFCVELLGHMISLYLSETLKFFPKVAIPFCIPRESIWSPSCSKSLAAFSIASVFSFSHSSGCVVVASLYWTWWIYCAVHIC